MRLLQRINKGLRYGLVILFCGWFSALALGSELWVEKAQRLQAQLEVDTPLSVATILGSHNSYNSKAYQRRYLGTYLFPNQTLSITAQLDIGVRLIELDVSTPIVGDELKLCHTKEEYAGIGCHRHDRNLLEGLVEIKSWMLRSENKREVVFLFIEDQTGGFEDRIANLIVQHFENLLYRPKSCEHFNGRSISKSTILNEGKRLVVFGGNCRGSLWPSVAFRDQIPDDNEPLNHDTYTAKCIGGFNFEHVRNYTTSMVKMYEDSVFTPKNTFLKGLFYGRNEPPPHRFSNAEIEASIACGRNVVALDQLDRNDKRLPALIWSWANGEPNNVGPSGEDCAELTPSGRINDAQCAAVKSFACKSRSTSLSRINWKITLSQGPWSWGESTCRTEFGDTFEFAVPASAVEMKALHTKTIDDGFVPVWLNYTDQESEGHWKSGTTIDINPAVSGPTSFVQSEEAWTRLKNGAGLCLEAYGSSTKVSARVNHCSNSDSQFWVVTDDGDLLNKSHTSLCFASSRMNYIVATQCNKETGNWVFDEPSKRMVFDDGERHGVLSSSFFWIFYLGGQAKVVKDAHESSLSRQLSSWQSF